MEAAVGLSTYPQTRCSARFPQMARAAVVASYRTLTLSDNTQLVLDELPVPPRIKGGELVGLLGYCL